MATLNVKNFPDGLYRKLRARARRERRSVAQEVARILAEALESPKPPFDPRVAGLGKECWQGVDGAAHVARERGSWD